MNLIYIFSCFQSWSNFLSVRWDRHRENRRSTDISWQSRKSFRKQCSVWIFIILLPEYPDGEQLPLVMVVFINVCILVYDHTKSQEEKLDYCVNYNRSTVCLAFPSSSHCYYNASEEIGIYWQFFILCQAFQGKYSLVNTCLILCPDVHDGTAWQRWLTLTETPLAPRKLALCCAF